MKYFDHAEIKVILLSYAFRCSKLSAKLINWTTFAQKKKYILQNADKYFPIEIDCLRVMFLNAISQVKFMQKIETYVYKI